MPTDERQRLHKFASEAAICHCMRVWFRPHVATGVCEPNHRVGNLHEDLLKLH